MRPETADRRTSTLQRFVPRIAADWDRTAPGRMWQTIDGSLCFVDISGFTSLSERLARRGRIGAEELTEVLNRVFGRMLGSAYEYGGSLLKFGGDALLIMFAGENHAIRAASSAVQMQTELRHATSEPTSVGKVPLRMSVGIHSGPIHLFCVGTSHRELVVTGPAGTLTTRMEHTAEAGEILVTSATRDALPRGAAPRQKGEGWLLKWRKPVVEAEGFSGREVRQVQDLGLWTSTALRTYLSAARPEPEHRIATVGFVRFCGVDDAIARQEPETVADALHDLITTIQDAADAEEVTFLASDINEDGGKVLLVSGAPSSHEDDEGRMLRTVRHIADAAVSFDIHIGVNRGHVYAGEVGTDYRSTYTVMGDTVNVAARLCAAAWADRIYATPEVLEHSHTLYASEALEPLHVKGKAEALVAYSVGEELGFRAEDTRTDLPFVGREQGLGQVNEVLRSTESRRRAVVSVVGDTGVGKSRLAEEALSTRSDLRVVRVRAEPYGMATPYRPLRDPVRALLGIERDASAAMAKALTRRIRDVDPALVAFVPLLGDVTHVDLEETAETKAIEPRFRRDRLADLVINVLGRLLTTPTVLLVEDAQWMDEASAHLLARVATATASHPWSMVVTRRPGDGGFAPTGGTLIELQPLTPAEAERLVIAATSAAPLRPHDVAAIVARAGGNPLFLEETLRVVRETGSAGRLPDSLGAVIGTRIDAMPPLARRILRYASVLGRSFRSSALRELLVEEGIALDAATRRELDAFIEADDTARLRFRHALARDVAYDGLSFRRRRQLHLSAGAAAERHAGDHVDDAADLLAMHYSLGADHERAWRFARIAGDNAKDAYANVEAATNYERAIESARRLGTVAAAERAEVWINLGDVRGPTGLFDDALEAYRTASRLLGDDWVARADVHYKRALMRERAGAYSLALREITTGYRMVEAVATPEAARIRARLAARRAFVRQAQERPAEALAMAEQAVAEAGEARALHAEGLALMILHWAHLMLGMPGGAEYGERALDIFRELDEPESLAAVTNLLGGDAYFAGRWDDAVEYYTQGREAAHRAGNVVHAALYVSNIGEVLVNQGRFDEAEPMLREAARVQRASGFTEGAAEMRLGRLLTLRGSAEEAEPILERTVNDFTELGLGYTALEARMDLALCRLRLGKAADAEAMLADIDRTSGNDFVVLAPTLARYRAETLFALGRIAEAVTEARGGLEKAESQHLEYERALLLLVIDALESQAPQPPESSGITEALQVLERLGVRDPSVLSPEILRGRADSTDHFGRANEGSLSP